MKPADRETRSETLEREPNPATSPHEQADKQNFAKLRDVVNHTVRSEDDFQKGEFSYTKIFFEALIAKLADQTYIVDQKSTSNETKSNEIGTLSSRELDCLQWCFLGKTYQEIAIILEISERTVDYYLASARKKVNANTNAHCAAKVIVQMLPGRC